MKFFITTPLVFLIIWGSPIQAGTPSSPWLLYHHLIAAANGPMEARDDASRFQQAKALFKEVLQLHASLDIDSARTKLQEVAQQFPEIQESKDYKKLVGELAVIGRDAGTLQASKWFQGETTYSDAAVTLVVFWESWCPHCQDEMPKLEALFKKYQEKGLNIVGLTKITDSSTSAVFAFIGEYSINFPIGKDSGVMSERYDVERIPAAVIIKNGKVLWRGSPQRLTENAILKALDLPLTK